MNDAAEPSDRASMVEGPLKLEPGANDATSDEEAAPEVASHSNGNGAAKRPASPIREATDALAVPSSVRTVTSPRSTRVNRAGSRFTPR